MSPVDFPLLSEVRYADLVRRWQEPHRGWHGIKHLETLLQNIAEAAPLLSPDDQAFLRYLALFHDAIYDPLSRENEEDSADLAAQYLPEYARREELVQAVLATKTHHNETALETRFNAWDCAILHEKDLLCLNAYERAIAFEYRVIDPVIYLSERCKFLRAAAQTYRNSALSDLADRIEKGTLNAVN